MKIVVGLGNPGSEYDATRHNVGWWLADRLVHDWSLPAFQRQGPAWVTRGAVGDEEVQVVKPRTFMNRSGAAVAWIRADESVDASTDLLVLVDDATRDVGQVRFRPGGGAGGHNGLRSVEAALGHNAYARLRIGVGRAPEGQDLADWVLSPMPDEDEETVIDLLPELTRAVEVWMEDGVEVAMNRFNR